MTNVATRGFAGNPSQVVMRGIFRTYEQIVKNSIPSEYSIKHTVSKSVLSEYVIFSRVTKTISSEYVIGKRISKSVLSRYGIIEKIAKSQTSQYAVAVRVTNHTTSQYSIVHIISKSQTSQYAVAVRITNQIISHYYINNGILKSQTSQYSITSRIVQSIPSQYSITNSITKYLTSQYIIAVRIVRSIASQYSIREIVTNSKIIRDVSTAAYSSNFKSITSEFVSPTGVAFNDNFSKMWLAGKDTDRIYQYTLTTPGDLLTAIFDNKTIGVSQGTQGISFNADYTRMYLVNSSLDTVIQYDLSTAEDISTAVQVSSYSVSSQEDGPRGIAVNRNVSKIWIVGSGADTVFQYALSTPGDLTTISYDNKSFSVGSQATFPQGVTLDKTETKMWVVGSSSDGVHQYSLSTPGDVSTASYDGLFYSLSGLSTNPTDVKFNDNFTRMYITAQHNNRVVRFEIPVMKADFVSRYAIIDNIVKSLTSEYQIINRVTKHLSSQYFIANIVTKHLSSQYRIADKISKQIISRYSIRNYTSKTSSSQYKIISRDVKNIISQYSIVDRLQNYITSKYQIAARVSKQIPSQYAIIQRVVKRYASSYYAIDGRTRTTIPSQYAIVGKIINFVSSEYEIKKIASNQITSQYIIQKIIPNQFRSKYEIASKIINHITSRYDIEDTSSNSVLSEYEIRKRIANTIPSQYTIVQKLINSIPSQYKIIQRVTKSYASSYYAIEEKVGLSIRSTYSISQRIVKFTVSTYQIKDNITNSIASTYEINGRLTNSIPSQYEIELRTQHSIVSHYNIKQLAEKIISSKYQILESEISQTESRYSIRNKITNSIFSQYETKLEIQHSIASHYTIKQLAEKTISSVYQILKSKANQMESKYSIRNKITNSVLLQYEIEAKVSKSFSSVYFVREIVRNTDNEGLADAVYDTAAPVSVSSLDGAPSGFYLDKPGINLFVVGESTNTVYQFVLDVSGKTSTMRYVSKSFYVGNQETITTAVYLNDNLSKMWVLGAISDKIHQYVLDTPGDISTARYNNKSFSIKSQEPDPRGLSFNDDFTKMYVVGHQNDKIHQYSLSTAEDIISASYDNKSFYVGNEEETPSGLYVNARRKAFFVIGTHTDTVYKYEMPDPNDISTAVYTGVSLDVSAHEMSPSAIRLSDDLSNLYVLGFVNDQIHQYHNPRLGLSKYSITSEVRNLHVSTYEIKGFVSKTFSSQYEIKIPVSITLDSAYDIREIVRNTDNEGLADAVYDTAAPVSVSSLDGAPSGFYLDKLGINLFIVGEGTNTVYQFVLDVSGKTSTMRYIGRSFYVGNQEIITTAVYLNNDLSKMWILGAISDKIHQYILSTPGDLSTAVYDSKSFSVRSQEHDSRGLSFNDNFTKMYVVGHQNDKIHQYSLSTAEDVSTASYDNKSFYVGNQEGTPSGMYVNPKRKAFFVVGTHTDTVYKYEMPDANDISTAGYTGVSLDVSAYEMSPSAIRLSDDLSNLYIMGFVNKQIHQYHNSRLGLSKYGIITTVTNAVDCTYTIEGKFAKIIPSRYQIEQRITKTAASGYSILKTVGTKSFASGYFIRVIVTDGIISHYAIIERVADGSLSQYSIISRVTHDVTSLYSIRSIIASNAMLSHYIIRVLLVNFTLSQYAIRSIIANIILSQYDLNIIIRRKNQNDDDIPFVTDKKISVMGGGLFDDKNDTAFITNEKSGFAVTATTSRKNRGNFTTNTRSRL